MKLELLQENLNHALSIVSRIIAAKPQLPILTHVHLSAGEGKLTLTTSNQEMTITMEIGAKVQTPGDFTLPGRTLVEIVSSLSAEKVSMDLDGAVMTLKAGGFKAAINGSVSEEYPSLVPHNQSGRLSWEMHATDFSNLVTKVVFSAASDEGRAVLTGVLLKSTENRLLIAATDGFRLSVLQNEKLPKETTTDLIIPARTLLEVARIVADVKPGKSESSKIKITLLDDTNQILFDLGETKIYSSLISGNFPDFEKIIPTNFSAKFSLDASELLKAVRLSSVFARESANIVKLKLSAGKLLVSANAPQVGEDESDIEVKTDNRIEDLSVAFNFHYLLDFLSAAGNSGEVTIELSGPTSPGVFRITPNPDFLHLIMPVRVQN